jgi:hypothetical protein
VSKNLVKESDIGRRFLFGYSLPTTFEALKEVVWYDSRLGFHCSTRVFALLKTLDFEDL